MGLMLQDKSHLFVALMLVMLVACGARTGLGRGAGDFGAVDLKPTAHDAPASRPSCSSLPNCIEAELSTPTGEVIPFARGGVITDTSVTHGTWLQTPLVGGLGMVVQLTRHAVAPGPVVLSGIARAFYVDLRFGEEKRCNLKGEGRLIRVDQTPGGVTEASFSGRMPESCPHGRYEVRKGWFRLTMP